MPAILILLLCAITMALTSCIQSTANVQTDRELLIESLPGTQPDPTSLIIIDTTRLRNYTGLHYDTTEVIQAAEGTKSVLFNRDGSRLYAMNLEGMSIYEIDRVSRKLIREFKFRPTPGKGWDYETDEAIPSFEEKPVEACLSHDDKILWVSLHNAGGIVPIHLDPGQRRTDPSTHQNKRIYIHYPGVDQKDSMDVPLIKTGRTPKVIAATEDSRNLLVSNWHSYNVSILETDPEKYPYAKVISAMPMSSIPRGIAVDDKNHRSFVAIMGGASIDVINNSVWMKEKTLQVAANPRHVVLDSSNHIFVSYNSLGRIACLDANTGRPLYSARTAAQPRTIMLSENKKFLFVTCYRSDTVQVFRVQDTRFEKIASLPCHGHPVGVDIYEDEDVLEAWVCSYTRGAISIFRFRKK